MEKDFDDDVLALEFVAEFSEKQKELLRRMREIEKTLGLTSAPSTHTKNLILCWLAGRLPADLPDEHIARRIKEAFRATQMFAGTLSSRPIFPVAIYARRQAVLRR